MPRRVVVADGPGGPSVQIDVFTEKPGRQQDDVSVAPVWSGHVLRAPTNVRGRDHDVALSPPAGHADFRIVSFAAADSHPAEPYWHRTNSIDFGMVLDGEIRLLLEDRHVDLAAGDVVVQFGTTHAWVNTSAMTCRMSFVMIGNDG